MQLAWSQIKDYENTKIKLHFSSFKVAAAPLLW
jgi:hypothetical protein